MKYRIVYRERDGREHRDVIGAETTAHARAVFRQAYPTARLTSLEPIQPPRAPRPAYIPQPGEHPVSDEQLAALRDQAHTLSVNLRHKLRV